MYKKPPEFIRFSKALYKLAVTREWLEWFKSLTDEQVKVMSPAEVQGLMNDNFAGMLADIEKAKLEEATIDRIKKLQLSQLLRTPEGKLKQVIVTFKDAVAKLSEQKFQDAWAVLKVLKAESPELDAKIQKLLEEKSKLTEVLAKHQAADEPKTWKTQEHRPLTESSVRRTGQGPSHMVPVGVVDAIAEYVEAVNDLTNTLDRITKQIS